MENRKKISAGTVVLYLLAVAVVAFNISLMFDNVAWGDEAYSLNLVRDYGFAGIITQTYVIDTHPPLYHLLLKIVVGNPSNPTDFAYLAHFDSLIPFMAGVVMAITAFRKYFGEFAAAMFIIFSGLADTCIRNNLEIRMYSWVFFFLLVSLFAGYLVLNRAGGKACWIIMLVFADLAGYTHYYGIMAGGLLVTIVAFLYFCRYRGKSWRYIFLCPVMYVVLYAPWLGALMKHLTVVKNDFWIKESATLRSVLRYILLGGRLWKIMFVLLAVLSVLFFFMEAGTICFRKEQDGVALVCKKAFRLHFSSPEFMGLCMCVLLLVPVVGLPYFFHYAYRPILLVRYMYVAVPVVLFLFMIVVSYFYKKAVMSWKPVMVNVICMLLTLVLFVPALRDGLDFRKETVFLERENAALLSDIGDFSPEALIVNGDNYHFGWTVLTYYFPENELTWDPLETVTDRDDIWFFNTGAISQEETTAMEKAGFTVQAYNDRYMAGYYCNIYHFWK